MRLERRIALLEYLLIALPMANEGLLHVEHSPIQESAPPARTFLDQMMDLRIDNLHGQEERQLGQRGGLISVDLRAHPGSRSFNPHGHSAGGSLNLGKDHESLRPMPDQMLQAPRPERAATAQNINGLKEAGLTRSVRPANQREVAIGVNFRRLQAAEIRYLQLDPRPRLIASSASQHSVHWHSPATESGNCCCCR